MLHGSSSPTLVKLTIWKPSKQALPLFSHTEILDSLLSFQATICLASDTGAILVFNSRWWHLRLGEEEDTLQNYEKIGPASYLALQNSVILLDLKAGYC